MNNRTLPTLFFTALSLAAPYAITMTAANSAFAGQETKQETKEAMPMTTSGKVANSPAEAKPLGVKSIAPNITLRTTDGKPFSLTAALKKQPTVLIFYRGGWCPYCNLHLASLQKIEPDLKTLGYQILAVSMDKPDGLRVTEDKNQLHYTLLSDSDAKAVRAFGVAYKLDDATVEKYKGYHVDLEQVSGHNHHILPVPAVFLIGTDRIIRFVHSDPDYKVRLSSEKVLEAAKAIHDGMTVSDAK